MVSLISSSEAVDLILSGTHPSVDVRSEGEFGKASVPGMKNAPILNDLERHAVGICYKVEGQQNAIALGHKLVDPQRDARVAEWVDIGSLHPDSPLLVCCWRGGMRSQFATEWIEAAGREAVRIEGGYKAIRAELMSEFLKPRSFLILSGRTGSGKTELLKHIQIREKIDIEDLAAHRGSSFGKMISRCQPSQATFENAMSLGLRHHSRPILLEDESKVIGRLHLPESLFRSMSSSPIVQLEASLADRSETIYKDYVVEPLQHGINPIGLADQLAESVLALSRKLGGALTDKIIKLIRSGFSRDEQTFVNHKAWIEILLSDYYDRAYDHASARNHRKVAFKGNYEECREWISSQYV